MAEKKSILEEALLDINNIEKALKANTKEILRSVMKEEINGVVKESLTNEVYEEEDLDSPEGETELGVDADAATAGLDAVGDVEDVPSDIASPEGVPAMEPEIGMDADALGGEMDMTAASDDDVIAIYKKLSGEDEIEIVVQIKGKVRAKLMVAKDLSREELQEVALADEKVKAEIDGKDIVKVISVPNKLVNIVVK